MDSILVVGLIQRYIVQALDQILPNLPAYVKPAVAAVLSVISSALGAVHAPASVSQALPTTGPFFAAALTWGATDAIHGVLNYVERKRSS